MDIFVIGPMTPRPNGVEIASNTKTIKSALKRIVDANDLTGWTVTAPDDLNGSAIVSDVLGQLDMTELVIADVSGPSPNVFYELSLADALGLPTVIVSDRATPIPFYLNQTRVLLVDAVQVDHVTTVLEPVILALAREQYSGDLYANPQREFYDAPIVDISAATGLAVGYYVNFVRSLIENDGILEQHRTILRGVLVILPDALGNQRSDREAMHRVLETRLNQTVEKGRVFPRGGTDRPFTADAVGRMVVDLSSAPYSLGYSPRLRRLDARLFHTRMDLAYRTAQLEQMSAALITAFERALRRQIALDEDKVRAERIHIARFGSLDAELNNVRDKGWW